MQNTNILMNGVSIILLYFCYIIPPIGLKTAFYQGPSLQQYNIRKKCRTNYNNIQLLTIYNYNISYLLNAKMYCRRNLKNATQ
jgi:hypothetical protein